MEVMKEQGLARGGGEGEEEEEEDYMIFDTYCLNSSTTFSVCCGFEGPASPLTTLLLKNQTLILAFTYSTHMMARDLCVYRILLSLCWAG